DQGDYKAALEYYRQDIVICRKISDRGGEGTALNNLAAVAYAQGEQDKALSYLEQSLIISREIDDLAGEAVTNWNIGFAYNDQGNLRRAEHYINRAVQLAKRIGHPNREEYRQALEELRAKLPAGR
ncbi:MAG: tetratricopeptide repeat protein, partial [Candidatus Electrothrix sp. AR4]|nr:tetratricopeptide repeat protein [Candidatus Electrothrix sp. AR4]